FFSSSRRRHTRFSRDWSSDVCSSDLNHVLDATQAYFRPLNEDELAGLSASHIELLKQYGKQHELDQPVATLDFPSYLAIMTHARSEEHTSELQSRENLVCRLLLEKKK